MGRLKDKLKELGYEYDGYDYLKKLKIQLLNLTYWLSFTFRIQIKDNKIIGYYIYSSSHCFKEDISNAYKQAFNVMHKDIEELKEYENV